VALDKRDPSDAIVTDKRGFGRIDPTCVSEQGAALPMMRSSTSDADERISSSATSSPSSFSIARKVVPASS
jgi:hypothetical protein